LRAEGKAGLCASFSGGASAAGVHGTGVLVVSIDRF